MYVHDKLPERWHYKHNARVASSIVLVAEKGYVFSRDFNPFVKDVSDRFNRTLSMGNIYGWNGYDNQHREMRTPVIVSGPDFRGGIGRVGDDSNATSSNATAVSVSVVDVFPLLCHALHIDPCPDIAYSQGDDGDTPASSSKRNGTLDAVGDLLHRTDQTMGEKIKNKIKEAVDFVSRPSNLPLTGNFFFRPECVLAL